MSDRRLNPISDAELDRRWKAARAMMTARGLDALVMQNNNDWLGGYVKWFTDFPAYNGYPRTVIFHAGDPMTLWLGLCWAGWAGLWFLYFLLLALGRPLEKTAAAATLASGVFTAWMPALAMLYA